MKLRPFTEEEQREIDTYEDQIREWAEKVLYSGGPDESPFTEGLEDLHRVLNDMLRGDFTETLGWNVADEHNGPALPFDEPE